MTDRPGRDKLEAIMDMQASFQAEVPDGITQCFKEMSGERTAQLVREQTLACAAELFEALDEIGWKPWATSRHVNVEAFRSELIDAFRFWLNLIHIAGLSADGVLSYYLESLAKTRARVEDGYDGVTSKCPGCKRAYDDTGAQCFPKHPTVVFTEDDPAWCTVVGHVSPQGDAMLYTPASGWFMRPSP
jgi:hypothetical protein